MTGDNIIDFPHPEDGPRERPGPRSGANAAELVEHLAELGVDPTQLPGHLRQALLGSLAAELADAPGAAFGPGAVLGAMTGLGPGLAAGNPFERRQPELLPRRNDAATYRLRVDLDDVSPPVWRRIDVPSDLPLDRLHLVLQAAMGWWDSHLHAFTMGPDTLDRQAASFLTPFDVQESETGILESDVRLDQVLAEPGQRLFYLYDFGDSWEHTLQLEKILPAGPAGVITGKRACPPEDCGGAPGYEDVIALFTGEAAEGIGPFADREELLEWLPDGWEPDAFDRDTADQGVRTIATGGTPGLPPLDDLAEPLADLLRRSRGTAAEPQLVALTAAVLADVPGGLLAGPDEEHGADDATIAEAMKPVQAVLEAIGDGVDLTAAGYLRPREVEAIAAGIDLGERWIGKMNREDLTPAVADLRTAVQRLGLIRGVKGRIVPTAAGVRLRGDALGLCRHVASRLPVGSAQQRDPATFLLLAVAGGGIRSEFLPVGGRLMQAVGWRGGRFTPGQFLGAVRPTQDALTALECFDPRKQGTATALGMDLATAALLRA